MLDFIEVLDGTYSVFICLIKYKNHRYLNLYKHKLNFLIHQMHELEYNA